MQTEDYLSHFVGARRAKDLGPYSVDNGVSKTGTARKATTARGKPAPENRRTQLTEAGQTSPNDLLEMVNESTSTATLLQAAPWQDPAAPFNAKQQGRGEGQGGLEEGREAEAGA